MAIPLKPKVLKETELRSEGQSESKRTLNSKIEARLSAAGTAADISLTQDCEVTLADKVQVEQEQQQRKIVLGLCPGVGGSWWMGQRSAKQNPTPVFVDGKQIEPVPVADYAAICVWGVPFSNCLTAGATTWFPWFSEFWGDWSPPWVNQSFYRPCMSLVGWAKTGGKVTVQTTVAKNVRTEQRQEPVPGASVSLAIPEIGFADSAKTDAQGRIQLDLGDLPVLSSTPLELRVEAPGVENPPKPVKLTIPPGVLGRSLATRRDWRDYRHSKFYVNGEAIDFSAGAATAAPQPAVTTAILERLAAGPAAAGVRVTVTNQGRGPLFRFLGCTNSDEPALDKHLVVFGKVDPGQSVTRELRIPVPKELKTGRYDVRLEFREANGYEPAPISLALDIEGLPRPVLACTFEVADDPGKSEKAVGNADGVIQKGEAFDLLLTVKNTGTGPAAGAKARLDLPSDPSVTLYGAAEADLGEVPPDGSRTARFNVAVKPQSALTKLDATVTLTETGFQLKEERRIELPFDTAVPQQPVAVDRDYYVSADQAVLRTGAAEGSSEYARAPKDTALHAVGELADWVQVELPAEQDGKRSKVRVWAGRSALTTKAPTAATPAAAPVVITRFGNQPPRITFVEPAAADLTTTDDRAAVTISIVDVDGKLTAVKVETGSSTETLRGLKVVPTAATADTTATAPSGDERVIRHVFELAMGLNLIRITATDDHDQTSQKVLTVRRQPKVGRTYVVAIGINTYPGQHALACARQDAELFRDFARANLGVEAEALHLLTDAAATRRQIMAVFGDLRRATKPEDTVIIFLAGHGWIERVGETEEKYFVPADADWQNLFATAIGMDEFARILQLSAERVLVVADACYSGAIKTRGGSDFFGGIAGKGRIVIGYEGAAREDRNLGHGYLTYYLVEALKGAGDTNRDGRITLREAYEFAGDTIRKKTGTGLWIKGEGDLELVRVRE